MKYSKELESIVTDINAVLAKVALLPDELVNVKVRIKAVFDQQTNWINNIAGSSLSFADRGESKPLTHILGVPIHRNEPVAKTDLIPDDKEKFNFNVAYKEMSANILMIDDEKLVKQGLHNPPVLRAVAKDAGITDYDTAKINFAFVKAIKSALNAKSNKSAKLSDIEKQIVG